MCKGSLQASHGMGEAGARLPVPHDSRQNHQAKCRSLETSPSCDSHGSTSDGSRAQDIPVREEHACLVWWLENQQRMEMNRSHVFGEGPMRNYDDVTWFPMMFQSCQMPPLKQQERNQVRYIQGALVGSSERRSFLCTGSLTPPPLSHGTFSCH